MDDHLLIDAVLEKLKASVASAPNQCVFNAPATGSQIADVESCIGAALPMSFKEFLRVYNGGFISIAGTTDDEHWDHGSAEWNSNALFGTDRLMHEFAEMKYNQVEEFGEPEPWHHIPFLHTGGQELLVFAPTLESNGERAVLDAFHESCADDWTVVYPSFTALLADYIARNGEIDTIGGRIG